MDDKEIKSIIQQNLIKFREEKNYTQSEIAKMVGKSPTAVASWEQGLSLPNPMTLYRLSQIYGKPMNEFCEKPKKVTVEDITTIPSIKELPNKKHHRSEEEEVPVDFLMTSDDNKPKVITLETQLKLQEKRLDRYEKLLNDILNKDSKKRKGDDAD